jgi:hypothetical protein
MSTKTTEAIQDNFDEHIHPHIEQTKQWTERYSDRFTSVVRDHPAVCLLGSLAAGYFVARVMRYRS